MKKFYFSLLIILLFLLTGCTKFDLTVDVSKKGHVSFIAIGDINEKLVFLSKLANVDLESLEMKFDTFERVNKEDSVQFIGKKELGNIVGFLFTNDKSSEDIRGLKGVKIETKEGLILNTYSIAVDTHKILGNFMSKEELRLFQLLKQSIPLSFHLNLPLPLYESNATKVEENTGEYTYTWTINFQEHEKMKAKIRVINIKNLVIAITLSAITFFILHKLINRKKRR